MVAHTARCLLSRATWTDLRTCFGGDDQAYHRSHRARGAEVDEAMLQCAGLLLGQLPVQGALLIWRLETFAGTSLRMLARHAILPWTVTTTVNRGCCLDVVRTRLRRAWRRGRTVFDTPIVLVATSSAPFISLSWCSAISYASRSMLDYAIMDLAHPWAAQYCWFLLRCSDLITARFTAQSRLLNRPRCSQSLQFNHGCFTVYSFPAAH